jgi:hypothetical protein
MRILCILAACLFVMSCEKETEIRQAPTSCVEMEENQTYTTIPFKEGYTIQLPSGHTGYGIDVSENIAFSVQTIEKSHLFYFYPCATDCLMYFGETLTSPVPDTIFGFYWQDGEVLTKANEFCLAGDVQAILYLNQTPGSSTHGKLYMKQKDDFVEGLKITFDKANLAEVESIIRTIAKQ